MITMVERAGLKVKKVYPTRLVCTLRANDSNNHFCFQRMALDNGGCASRGEGLKWTNSARVSHFRHETVIPRTRFMIVHFSL